MNDGQTYAVSYSSAAPVALPSFQFFIPATSAQAAMASTVTLGQAIADVLKAKAASGRRIKYVKGLKRYLTMFARGRESMPIGNVRLPMIEDWFTLRAEAINSQRSNRARLSALFSFAKRRGWVEDNPIRLLELLKVDQKVPEILTIEQVELLLHVTRLHKPNQLAYLTLAMLAGIRPSEMEGITWNDVNLERGQVVVDGAASKVRRRRIVPLQPNALEWLKLAKQLNALLPVSEISRKRYVRHFREMLGSKWLQDCLRHTAASYLMATYEDAGEVARWLGNSPSILLTHYTELVQQDVAERFWNIRPGDAERSRFYASAKDWRNLGLVGNW